MSTLADDAEARLVKFNSLIQELLRGRIQRNTFQPWEVEILLDIEACDLREANRRETLRRYQKAAARYVEHGGGRLLKLSEYLAKRHGPPIRPTEKAKPDGGQLLPDR